MAGIAINSFLNKVLTDGVPRTSNMWTVDINSGVDAVDKYFADFTMYTRDFKMPGISLTYADLKFRSIPIPVPTSINFQNSIRINMYADCAGMTMQSLRTWMTRIIDIDLKNGSYLGGTRSINPQSTLRLNLLDYDMQTVTETCTLVGATIESIGDLSFTHDNSNIVQFSAGFKYAYPSFEFPE